MFQNFTSTSNPEQGVPRLAALRKEFSAASVDGFLIPRADVHQGENVAAHDARLAWLSGFTGSAGFCAALKDVAGLFVDGRYRLQGDLQTSDDFTIVPWPETKLSDWLVQQLPNGGTIGFDPWLHTAEQIEQLQHDLARTNVQLVATENLVDAIWEDQPEKPSAPAVIHGIEFAGESSLDKRQRLARSLVKLGAHSAVITLPDSLCWLLNIRGSDIPHTPVMHGFGVLHDDGTIDLFAGLSKTDDILDHLGAGVTRHAPEALVPFVQDLQGPVLIEKSSVPMVLNSALVTKGTDVIYGADPCALPKACKNQTEIDGAISAHLRDGAAVTRFLGWFEDHATTGISEIDVVRKLEDYRRETNLMCDTSFDTIAGTGPNGAIMHYRVSDESSRDLQPGEIMVLDSGAQYRDGTTDVTRTLPIGPTGQEEKRAFTLVLKGMIALSVLHWPKGLAGGHIESIARAPLWQHGMDFDHGVGHGVGSYLGVHEGPQRLSRVSNVPLEPGMMLSNEPGYYRNGAFGIRLENLVVVEEAPKVEGGDSHRDMLRFQTLTYVPIDLNLIELDMLDLNEKTWLNSYHQDCFEKLSPLLSPSEQGWLKAATRPV